MPVGIAVEMSITDYVSENSVTTVTVSLQSSAESEIRGGVYAAVYDTKGVMKGAGMADMRLAAGAADSAVITVPCEVAESDTVKAFAWSGNVPAAYCTDFTTPKVPMT